MKKEIYKIKSSIMSVLLTGFFLVNGSQGFSQTKAKPRTYEFVFFNEDSKDVFFSETTVIADSMLIKIEQLRQAEDIVYAKFSERTFIKIIPGSVINSSGFAPLEKSFIEHDTGKQQDILNQLIDIEK